MVFAAIAQSMAFSYQDFADARSHDTLKTSFKPTHNRKKPGVCEALGQVLFSTRDVIEDAHSTFIKDVNEEKDKQLQLDELKKAKNSAFNWSDEELLGDVDDLSNIVYKDKYQKPKRKITNSSYTSTAQQLKQKVKQGYTAAKAGLGSTPNSINKHTDFRANQSPINAATESVSRKKHFVDDPESDDTEERTSSLDMENQTLMKNSMELLSQDSHQCHFPSIVSSKAHPNIV